jgi:hypothetical protein
VGVLLLVTALSGARAPAASEETPDAQMLLDLDILMQPEAQDRDLMRRLSLFERLRLLEMFRLLDEPPAAAARRPGAAGAPAAPPAGTPAPSAAPTPAPPPAGKER